MLTSGRVGTIQDSEPRARARRFSIPILLVFIGILVPVSLLLGGHFFHFLEATSDEMVRVPAGPFIMGSDKKDATSIGFEFGVAKPLYLDEHPQHTVTLPAFYIDHFEVTNADYSRFVRATGYRTPDSWRDGKFSDGHERYPVIQVSWYEAGDYCRWAGKRLPSEAEWEKAARGPGGLEFPWGDTFSLTKANVGSSGLMPVGSFKDSPSPYGAEDLVGNAWEWVEDSYRAYPGGDYQSEFFGPKYRVIRGSSYYGNGHYNLPVFHRGAFRYFADPHGTFPDVGFRCAK